MISEHASPLAALGGADAGGQNVHVAALAAALARRGELAWIVCTSAVAVERVMALLRDGRDLAGIRLAAVGPATAAALAGAGLVADVVAEPATAEGLVAAMPAPGAGDGAVLYPRAAGARPVLAEGLRAKGWEVRDVVAYVTAPVPAGELPAELLDRAADADAVTFTSPSTVAAYLALAGDRPVPPLVACIGPVTADAARRAGLRVAVEADEHGVEGLVAALVAAVAAGSGTGPPVR